MSHSNQKRRVVVTGLGVISSLGIGWQEFWKNLLAGKSGISPVTAFDTSHYDRHMAGEVKNFDPTKFINRRKINLIGRASQMAIAGCKLALADSKLSLESAMRNRTGVSIGTTTGEIGLLEHFDNIHHGFDQRVFEKSYVAAFPANALSAHIAMEFKLRGHNSVFGTACASGNYAIGWAYDLIRSGEADYFLAGGVDGFSRIVFTGFGRLFAIAPEKCQPFDRNRKGMIPAEGAGMLLLESLESAEKRKAPIYGEVLGYGISSDAHHMTNPSWEGMARVMETAIKNSGLEPKDVDYISAHGTGTPENDKAECLAFAKAFGEHLSNIPVSSIKSMLGHTMGAAAAIESIACCLAIKDSKIPPTMNFVEKDPNCPIDCVPNKYRAKKVEVALNNSSAFGGNNACVVIRKV